MTLSLRSRKRWRDAMFALMIIPSSLVRLSSGGQGCFQLRAWTSTALRMILPSWLVYLSMEVDGQLLRLAMGCMTLSLRSRKRWRDAVFEGPFGRSPGRNEFAEPSNDKAVRFHPR